jgi:hypothetical protein
MKSRSSKRSATRCARRLRLSSNHRKLVGLLEGSLGRREKLDRNRFQNDKVFVFFDHTRMIGLYENNFFLFDLGKDSRLQRRRVLDWT